MKTGFLLFLAISFIITKQHFYVYGDSSSNLSLSILRDVSGGSGGEPFSVQPILSIESTINVPIDFEDLSLLVSLSRSRTFNTTTELCHIINGTVSCGNQFEFPITSNKIQISGFLVNKAEESYRLKFILKNKDGDTHDSVLSNDFNVVVGPAYKIGILANPENAYGGSPFKTQPIVAIQDRGSNTVTSINEGTISTSIVQPSNKTLKSVDETCCHAPIESGVARFSGLFIEEKGIAYVLSFSTTLKLLASKSFQSLTFSVGIGPPSNLRILQYVSDNENKDKIFGGKPFPVQPKIALVDRGGNILDYDSISGISIGIHSNPSAGSLIPISNQFLLLSKGTAQFRGLSIDIAANGYSLFFSLLKRNSSNKFEATNINIVGPCFNVLIGGPHSLQLFEYPKKVFANNQPFKKQPKLRLIDRGGNILIHDSLTKVNAFLVPSLAHSSSLIIETREDPIPFIKTIKFKDNIHSYADSNEFVEGDKITIEVVFSQEVSVLCEDEEEKFMPFLQLNLLDGKKSSFHEKAVLHLSQTHTKSLLLSFSVRIEHAIERLDFTSDDAFNENGCRIIDYFMRNVSLVLPSTSSGRSLAFSSNVTIDNTKAVIESISTSPIAGEYGVGEDIDFFVTFTRKVIVKGMPKLPLSILGQTAKYIGGTGTHVLVFRFSVKNGDATARLGTMDSSDGVSIICSHPHNSIQVSRIDGSPSLVSADLSIDGVGLPDDHSISIDSTPPYVVKVNITGNVTGSPMVYTIGESVFIEVEFSKPVTVTNGIRLALETGNDPGYAYFDTGSGTKILVFKYKVKEGHVSADLDYVDENSMSLEHVNEGWVRRSATTPIQDADLILPSSGNTLADLSNIIIDGTRPRIIKVNLDEGYKGTNYSYADTIIINVDFSANVSFVGIAPSMKILLDHNQREAKYLEGYGTKQFQYAYKVQIGDSCSNCKMSFLHLISEVNSYIVRHCSNPPLPVNVTMSLDDGANGSIVPIFTGLKGISIDTSKSPLTSITSVETSTSDGVYGVGEKILFYVHFSDIVHVNFTKTPFLCVNLGGSNCNVSYLSGSGSRMLSFQVITSFIDATEKLDWVFRPESNSAITCESSTCSIKNENKLNVDLSFKKNNSTFVPSLYGMVAIDTKPPTITRVFTTKVVSTSCQHYALLNGCTYTVGERIPIFVEFSSPIVVSGAGPCLLIDSGVTGGSTIIYEKHLSNATVLGFLYEVQEGHSSFGNALTYLCEGSCSLDLNTNYPTYVRRMSSYPRQDANITLPLPSSLGISKDDLNQIKIDTYKATKVVNVYGISLDGDYSPGDTVLIAVEFNDEISVFGNPILYLELGQQNRSYAQYKEGDGTKILIFALEIEKSHRTNLLEYMDIHSLEVGRNGPKKGKILQKSTIPFAPVNLTLPAPRTEGSLSVNSFLRIDNRVPYITSISSPQHFGTYHTDDHVYIQVQFSVEVVVTGYPYIKLETGNIDRLAGFIQCPDNRTLDFLYIVRLGDSTDKLDYWSDLELFQSSSMSFQLNNGSIKRKSSKPIIDADIHLNPPMGYLGGIKTEVFAEGVATFRDLRMGLHGADYKVRFKTRLNETHEILEDSFLLPADFSIEHEIRGDQISRNEGDLYGHSVDISGDWLAIGAPHKRNPIREIQILSVYSETKNVKNEIQLITTQVDKKNGSVSIISFSTSASPMETIQGFFSLSSFDAYSQLFASPIILPSDCTAELLKIRLTIALPFLKEVKTTRERNKTCKCENAWEWRVTFLNNSLRDTTFKTNGEDLIANGALISQVNKELEPNLIGGTFTLINPSNGDETRNIPYDASNKWIKFAIEEDLKIQVESVFVENTDQFENLPQLGRRWIVSFSHHIGTYGKDINVPNLEPNYDMLNGFGAFVWTRVGLEGQSPLSGTFALSLRGSSFSSFIPYDSSSDQIKTALESVESINHVIVSKRENIGQDTKKFGFKWKVTFDSINFRSKYGWLYDPGGESNSGNLPPLHVKSNLVGWKATFLVEHENGSGDMDTQAQWMEKRMGDSGLQSGVVDLYKKNVNRWDKVETLKASDFSSYDKFGFDVSIQSEYLLVGAPIKRVNGLPEQQKITCNGPATGGSFVVVFRGQTSAPIQFNSNLDEIKQAFTAEYGSTRKLHTLPKVSIIGDTSWNGKSRGFCEESITSILISFFTPDGGGISTLSGSGPNIEKIHIKSSNLIGANITVEEIRNGTRSLSGKEGQTKGISSGSAYLFRRFSDCQGKICNHEWKQVQKFSPLSGFDAPSGSALFGYALSLNTKTADAPQIMIIGSPGYNLDSGKVYVFKVCNYTWTFFESVTSITWDTPSPNDRYGYSVASYGKTVVVSAPGRENNRGSVYIYMLGNNDRNFLASQKISGPKESQTGDSFGNSLSFEENELVICAPMKVHVQKEGTGVCYIYRRKDEPSAFRLIQELIPSNIKVRDRFGYRVAYSDTRIVVSQVENFQGKSFSPRPIQVLRTFCRTAEPCLKTMHPDFRVLQREGETFLKTRPIAATTTATRLKHVLEEDLKTGDISVSRSSFPDNYGGYSWSITFETFHSNFAREAQIPLLDCEPTEMMPGQLQCEVEILQNIPKRLRGKAHIFTKDHRGIWKEQCFLFPNYPQRQDKFGSSVAIANNIVVVGASNRELLNVNSGAVLLFHIDFLNLSFDSSTYDVIEGNELNLKLTRLKSETSQFLRLQSLNKNTSKEKEGYVNWLFSFHPPAESDPLAKTASDYLTHDTAFGRSQYYGSMENRSLWIQGMFDYRAISDYTPLDNVVYMRAGETVATITLKTNDDHILEFPDEKITVQIALPGMFASIFGDLTSIIRINDDGDGIGSSSFETFYDKIIAENVFSEYHFGNAVAMDEESGTLVVGCEWAPGINSKQESIPKVGTVFIFNQSSGVWSQTAILRPNRENIVPRQFFGQSVTIKKAYRRKDLTVLVGSPGEGTVYVFRLRDGSNSWEEEAILRPTTDFASTQGKFGSYKALSLLDDLAFVGCPGTESTYVYRRTTASHQPQLVWNLWTVLKSSEYDYDLYDNGFTTIHIHVQGFGSALASSNRLLLIGAPYADYANKGSLDEREKYDTDGIHNKGLGKGKVYAFYSKPHVQIVTLESDKEPMEGSFRLALRKYKGFEYSISDMINHDASQTSFKLAIEALDNIGEIEVYSEKRYGKDATRFGYEIRWIITFASEVEDNLPTFEVLRKDNGCNICTGIKMTSLSKLVPTVSASVVQVQRVYKEEDSLQPFDITSTDHFGYSIAVDGNHAIIGAIQSAAKARTTWDFETGNLIGWSRTGNAFDFQPTFGDNSFYRPTYSGYGDVKSQSSGQPQSSLMKGRYYIGTYDNRPGKGSKDYLYPSKDTRAGTSQGDEKIGTLTSDPFLILGDTISFLVGGGCNHLREYVELLVDGYSTMRSTGKCSEKMFKSIWTVREFLNRSAQIRIVDNGVKKWGHINVDDFEFSWSLKGSCSTSTVGTCTEGGGALPRSTFNQKQHYSGREESPMSGAAYIFQRNCSKPDYNTNSSCFWTEESRLVPSDKSEGSLFGYSLSINDEQGIAIVGSINAPSHGLYHELQSTYPHWNPTMIQYPISGNLENFHKNGGSLAASGGNLRLINHIQSSKTSGTNLVEFQDRVGAIYFFQKIFPELGPNGEVVNSAYWPTSEHAKISAADGLAGDQFGYSLTHDGSTVVIGAIGSDSFGKDSGAAYILDTKWQRIRFIHNEYVALEGTDDEIMISIERDLSHLDTVARIGYSTSDLSAVGVDVSKFSSCLDLPSASRQGCGDYQQATGEITFDVGESFAFFTIKVMNDFCSEVNMEYVQLYLHIPGGGPIHGEHYRAQLRIDDDDWLGESTSLNCTNGIS